MPLVEFDRAVEPRNTSDALGEDDATSFGGPAEVPKISFNPLYVAAVFESQQDSRVSIVKLADGRGFLIRGTYAETMDKLQSSGAAEQTSRRAN